MYIYFVKPGGDAQTNFPHQYAVLSAYVKGLGHKTNYYDGALGHETPEAVLNKLDLTGVNIIGISVITSWHAWTKRFTALLRQKHPGIKVVVGGHHITGLRELAVEHIEADYGVVGEGETPLGKLLENLGDFEAIKKIPGIIYRENGAYRQTPFPLESIKNLDDLPLPDYDLIRPSDYFHTYLGASVARMNFRNVQTVTSRGCPHRCTFCSSNSTWGAKVKFYSPDRVLKEIKLLVEKHGIREFWLGDDGFTASKKRAVEICERLIDEKLNIPWRIPNGVRLDTLDDNLVSLMKKAGCYMTGIGIETGSPEMMTRIKKRLDLNLVEEKVRLLKKHGILTSGFFMLGFPGETEKTMQETIDFIMKSSLPRMQICVYVPLPGSETFDEVFGIGDRKLYEENVRKFLYEGYIPEIKREVSVEKVQECYSKTIFRFYTQPRVISNILLTMKPRQIKDIFMRYMFYDGIFDRNRKKNSMAKTEA